jgi:hypothetical protein
MDKTQKPEKKHFHISKYQNKYVTGAFQKHFNGLTYVVSVG